MFYTAQSGIWQTVWMEEVPSVHISSVLAVPDFDSASCRLLVQVTASQEESGQSKRTDTAAAKHAVTARIRPETEADRLLRDDPASIFRHGRKPKPDPSAKDTDILFPFPPEKRRPSLFRAFIPGRRRIRSSII